ncbi:MAG: AI-2E family transporter [Gemmatimonadetes bacterium]|nr:AI-2E family transporter [Gemmatimonadota bacterium]
MAAEETTGPGAAEHAVSLELIAKGGLIIIGLWALANGLWMARDVLFIAFFALLVASFLSIFVEPLHRRGISRSISAPLLLLAIVGVLVLFIMLSWPTLRTQFGLLQEQLPPAIDRLQDWFDQRIAGTIGPLIGMEDGVEQEVSSRISSDLGTLIGGTLPLLNTAVGAVTGFGLVIIAGMFIAISPRTYMRGIIVLVPRSHRRRAGEVLPEAGESLVQWMKGTALAMAAVGIFSAIGLTLIGVPAALALGLIAGVMEFIPYIGPVLGFVPATIIALTISPEKALWVIGLYVVVQGLESNVLTPLLMKQMVELPPALTLLFQALMAALFGFLGLLLAVPILATAKVLIQELYVESVADEH